MKYNKMVEMSKKKSQQNIKIVEKEIERMLKQGELIQVSELARRTGFSSSFFYKNEQVKKLIEQAKKQQENVLKSQNGKIHIPEEIEEKMKSAREYAQTVLELIAKQGREENSIHPEFSDFQIQAVAFPALFGYFVYLAQFEHVSEKSKESMREFTCANLLSILGKKPAVTLV